jgi:cell division protein FtsA
MNPERIIAGLDIGSSKTTALIAQAVGGGDTRSEPTLKILGVGQARTTGLRRGVVSDIEETTKSIKKAIEDAERMSGIKIDTIYAGIAGER